MHTTAAAAAFPDEPAIVRGLPANPADRHGMRPASAPSTATFEVSDEPDLPTMLRSIAASGSSTSAATIDEFVRITEPMNRQIGMRLCRAYKADLNTWLDDFIQIVRMASHELLTEVIDNPERAEEIGSYRALLDYRARSKAKRFVDSTSGFNQASGMQGWKRRRDELERTRAYLLQNGGDPSDQEIVDETNRRLKAARSDYERQGMRCTVDDLHVSSTAEDIEDHAHPVSRSTVESESDLHATEKYKLVIACVAACDAVSEELGQIARIWFHGALNEEYDGPPTAAKIASQMNIQASTARAKVSRVRQIAQQVARTQFGLSNDPPLSAS